MSGMPFGRGADPTDESLSNQGETKVTPATALTARIRAEFLEMPGLKLTLPQARRLWNVDEASCQQALATLAAEDFLYQTRSGAYVLLPSASGLR
jgi:hypothetical protein